MPFDPNAPRKPFVARGSRTDRCESCLLSESLCICDYRPNIKSNAVFWLLTHHDERYKPTNTGRLILDAFEHSDSYIWSRTELDPKLELLLESPDYYPIIVFPFDTKHETRMVSARNVKAVTLESGKRPAFILLDGTWRQARRMFRLSQYLKHLPVIEPSIGRKSRYHLRKASEEHHLCTAEVAAVILEDMEETQPALYLNRYFDLFNASYYASRMAQAKAYEAVAIAKERLVMIKPNAE